MNRRATENRRLQNLVVKDERREMMRRNLDEWRRIKEDRRKSDEPVAEERRKSDRREEAVENLQADHPEFNLPVDPTK